VKVAAIATFTRYSGYDGIIELSRDPLGDRPTRLTPDILGGLAEELRAFVAEVSADLRTYQPVLHGAYLVLEGGRIQLSVRMLEAAS